MQILPVTRVLFTPTSTRRLQNTRFGAGVFVQRAERLPTGPSLSDRQWAAENLNSGAGHASDDEWADYHERLTLSRDEFLGYMADAEIARLDRYERASEAEVAEMGSQVGHDAGPMSHVRRKPRSVTRHQRHRTARLAKGGAK